MAPRVAFLSFRFGPNDGVSAVTRTWCGAFAELGFGTVSVAGEGEADRLVTGFGLTDPPSPTGPPPDEDGLRHALADVDLVVVENLLTIPLNLPASRVAAKMLAGRPTIVHHHDPPWHRDRFAHITELPVDDPAWRHVAINHVLGAELAERGIEATVIHNAFELPSLTEDDRRALRAKVRDALEVAPEERLVVHPVRAIQRKNIPAALALAEALGATYWLLGPAEEGYDEELRRLLDGAGCRVIHRAWRERDEFYAAADHVTFPSTWEGFGNPPIEAALRRLTASVGRYPVADYLRGLGFEWFDPDDVSAIRAALEEPDGASTRPLLERNEQLAREHFGLERMTCLLRDLLSGAGWLP